MLFWTDLIFPLTRSFVENLNKLVKQIFPLTFYAIYTPVDTALCYKDVINETGVSELIQSWNINKQ